MTNEQLDSIEYEVGSALLAAILETPTSTAMHLTASAYGGRPGATVRWEWSNPAQYGAYSGAVSSMGAKDSPVLARLDEAIRAALTGPVR